MGLASLLLISVLGAHPLPVKPAAPAADPKGATRMDLSKNVGGEVTITGKVAQIPWQHMIHPVPGKQATYFDLEDGGQIVVYVAGRLPREQRLKLTGKVLELVGTSKRPSSQERYVEYQLDVTRWEP